MFFFALARLKSLQISGPASSRKQFSDVKAGTLVRPTRLDRSNIHQHSDVRLDRRDGHAISRYTVTKMSKRAFGEPLQSGNPRYCRSRRRLFHSSVHHVGLVRWNIQQYATLKTTGLSHV